MGTSSRVARGAILKRFADDKKGSVAVIFALTLLPVLGMAGVAIDYSAASGTRAQMAQAADAAALAAARAPVTTLAERQKIAQDVFNANMGGKKVDGLSIKVKEIPSGIRVDATGAMKTQFVGMMGFDKVNVGVFSEVARGEGFVEVALVLDNTGSMKNDMDALRKASTNFVNTIFAGGSAADSLRVSVVPYVAAVNPGRANLGMSAVDVTAQSPHHASIMRNKVNAMMKNCDPKWEGGGGGGGGNDGPGSGGDGAWLLEDGLNKLASIGRELFGVKPAVALGETPNTVAPLSGTWYSPPTKHAPAGTKAFVPTGFHTNWNPCQLVGPSVVNHLDLFDRIPGVQWAGCVEARPEPFDVSEDPPNPADPRTLFVPYFWPDEPGAKGEKSDYRNNYMDDNPVPEGWQPITRWNWEGVWGILKYNKVNTPDLTNFKGPNRGCPDELQRLTSDKSAVLSKISAMKAYEGGGGTISSEGVAWGLRTLSPKKPFADGKDYGKAKKFLVLMSDGENEIGENNKWGPTVSNYSAYGYLAEGRFGKVNFAQANKYLDGRFEKACENAKAAGVTVMTVYFRDNNSSAKNLMKKCASSGMYFFEAADAKALDAAFQQIASEIGKIRITK
jgi:Flp pilus assembly protein TadG